MYVLLISAALGCATLLLSSIGFDMWGDKIRKEEAESDPNNKTLKD